MRAVRRLLPIALLLFSGPVFANLAPATLALSDRLGTRAVAPRVEAAAAFPLQLQLDASLRRGLVNGALETGQAMIGTRYEFGADRDDAVDCSALVRRMFGSVGKLMPRTTRELMAAGRPVAAADLRPGDLLFYRFGKRGLHVAVLLDSDRVLHASPSRRQVVTSTLGDAWRGRRIAVRRFVSP